MKLKPIIMSVIVGLLTGPLYILVTLLLDTLFRKYMQTLETTVELATCLSLIVAFLIVIPAIRKTEKKVAVTAMILLILTSTYCIGFVTDLMLIGPGPEQRAYMYLLAEIRDRNGRISPNWTASKWDFYRPRCYTAYSAVRCGNKEVAVFYYGYGKTKYNPNSILKRLFVKLSCGITDSRTAYEDYMKLLNGLGFKVKAGKDRFTARNGLVTVYCRLEGDYIIAVRIVKGSSYPV